MLAFSNGPKKTCELHLVHTSESNINIQALERTLLGTFREWVHQRTGNFKRKHKQKQKHFGSCNVRTWIFKFTCSPRQLVTEPRSFLYSQKSSESISKGPAANISPKLHTYQCTYTETSIEVRFFQGSQCNQSTTVYEYHVFV